MLAPNLSGMVTTLEVSQQAEFPDAAPGGRKNTREAEVLTGTVCDRAACVERPDSPLPFLPCSSCHVCGFETELNVQFVSHMSLHVDKEQWMFSICCTACDFVTMEEAEIKSHIVTKHAGSHPLHPTVACACQKCSHPYKTLVCPPS